MAGNSFAWDALASTTGTTDTDLPIAISETDGRHYLVLWNAAMRNATIGKYGYIGVKVDGGWPSGNSSYTLIRQDEDFGAPTEIYSGGGFLLEAPSSSGFKFVGRAEATSTTQAWNMSLLALDVEDIWDDPTQMVYSISNPNHTMSTTETTVTSIEVTPNELNEEWIIFSTAGLQAGANAYHQFKTYNDEGDLDKYTQSYHLIGSSGDFHWLHIFTRTLTEAGTFYNTVRSNATSKKCQHAGIVAIRRKSLSTNAGQQFLAPYDIVSASTPEKLTGSGIELTTSAANDLLLMVNVGYDANAADSGHLAYQTKDGGATRIPADISTGGVNTSVNATDVPQSTIVSLQSGVTETATYETYVEAENAAAVIVYANEYVLELDGGDGGYTPPATVALQGDVSPQYVAALASAASVTPTSGEIVGQLNEIAGGTAATGLAGAAAKLAAESAAGL